MDYQVICNSECLQVEPKEYYGSTAVVAIIDTTAKRITTTSLFGNKDVVRDYSYEEQLRIFEMRGYLGEDFFVDNKDERLIRCEMN